MTEFGQRTGTTVGRSGAAEAGPRVTGDRADRSPSGLAGILDLRDAEREAAIARVFDQSHAKLVRLAVLLGAGPDAEDVVAEAFCQLYRRYPKLRSPDAAPAYVRGAVVNLVRMRLRHLQVVRRHRDQALRPSDTVSAERVVLDREDQRAVVTALEELAPVSARPSCCATGWTSRRPRSQPPWVSPAVRSSRTRRARCPRSLEPWETSDDRVPHRVVPPPTGCSETSWRRWRHRSRCPRTPITRSGLSGYAGSAAASGLA